MRTKSPSVALLVVAAFSLILVLVGTYGSSQAMALIVGMAALGYYAVYGLTVIAVVDCLTQRGSLPTKTSFDLGRLSRAWCRMGGPAVDGVLVVAASPFLS